MICFLVEIVFPLKHVLIICQKLSPFWRKKIYKRGPFPIHSNQMMNVDIISLFMRVPTDETLTVVWDKLAADPSLEECTCIPIDNLMKMLNFCSRIWYTSTRRTGNGITIVTSIGKHIHGILWRNGIRIHIIKAIIVT